MMELQTQTQPAPAVPFSTGCCPPFDPGPWQEKELVWKQKLFVKDHVRCFFHVPIQMGARVARNQRRIEAAQAAAEQPLMLCDDSSPWGTDLYIAVSRDVPGAQMTRLSGTFLTRVYEGPYRNAGKWAAEMQQYVSSKERELEKLYFAYTTCPACAKAYGKNYVVAFAQVHEGARGSSTPA
jgi:hypothetical protein